MNLEPIQWDKQEMFTAPNGAFGVRYATSDRDGVTCEFSMHDPTIQSMLPIAYWLPVHSAPINNAKIDRIDGRLVVLCGFGKPNDPMGNLVLMRVASRPGFSLVQMERVFSMIFLTLAELGIRFDKSMENQIRGN